MDTTLISNDNQQLIQMSSLKSEKNNHNVSMYETTTENNDSKTSSKCTQSHSKFFMRLRPNRILRSFHIPSFSDVNLRRIFLFFITLIGFTSFTISLIVGSSTLQFKHQCPLYATFKFQLLSTTTSNSTIKILPASEKFSSQSTCDFCTFFNVSTFIYCIITGFFFVLFNGDQSVVTTNDRYLIIPWFMISIILGLLALINASILTNGFLKFCTTITTNDKQITSCAQLNQLFFEQYPNVSLLFFYMLIAIIESWLQLALFIGVITILTIRLSTFCDWNSDKHRNGLNGDSIGTII